MVFDKEAYFSKYGKEWEEVGKDQLMFTGYPKPLKRWKLVYESFQNSIEECYYWILNYMRHDLGFLKIEKITDIFAASEHSAFFGVAQQRIGLQQDKVSQYLATIGKMIKDIFQLVRELRIIDERLGYYADAANPKSKSRHSAEITLKGIWVDMVEGGSKNPGSVYGLAAQLQFTTLPDLFYSIHPTSSTQVDAMVDKLDFNNKVKEVLKRKLRQFLGWKESTEKELNSRRTFTIKYLRQHYESIKMYMTWVKPYLKNIQRLQMEGSKADTPDLLAAFESSLIEIEILGYNIPEGNKHVFGCGLVNFSYRTRPSLSYQQEGYNRGPIHVGEVIINWRFYTWTEEEAAEYKALRASEDFNLLATIDSSIKIAMDALGDDLMKYLKEAGEDMPDYDPGGPPAKEFPTSRGFFGYEQPQKKKSRTPKEAKAYKDLIAKEKKTAAGILGLFWLTYKNFKKSHGIVAW